MSGILTNNGAMVALQTLKSINSDLTTLQSQISTGKTVGSAKDNAAIWAISKVMESDVRGFKGISDSLSLGQSTVALARQGAETVTELLTQMKEKIVSAQGANVDRAKIQTDVTALKNQISSVVGAAQFNGLNLLTGSATEVSNINVLSSLDRSGAGVVASDINVQKIDLSTNKMGFTGGTYAAGTGTSAALLNSTSASTLTITAPAAAGGDVYAIGLTKGGAYAPTASAAVHTALTTGESLAGARLITYVSAAGETAADVAAGLAKAYADYAEEHEIADSVLKIEASGASLSVTASTASTGAGNTMTVRVDRVTAPTSVSREGGLSALQDINVTTEDGVNEALDAIEGLIQNAVDAASAFGSIETRIGIQAKFISALTDSLKSGIGTLTETNMEEASARLQALQVQQQLGIQALSIANQAPQSLLSLFRG